ncbi:hypothetical protein PUN28_014950 [Cardiocondyla obscurior]|uniref:Cytochrome P450 18a1 n=1 Tax=Cardiocondyla obscurior TaxID=286306 RepID=A0AAW2F1B3_9HYME
MLVEQLVEWLWLLMGGTSHQVFCTLLVFVGVLLLVKIGLWLKSNVTLPPGPLGVPLLGYLPFIKDDAHLHFTKLAKRFGSIFSMYLGSELVVVLSDYRVIRDAFRREEFSGRPNTDFMNVIEGYGIINTQGALWKDQRKFLHEKLRSFGMTHLGTGKKSMNTRIMREVEIFLWGLVKRRGKPTNISPSLAVSISNVICSLTMSVRFHNGDLNFKRFMDLIDEGFRLFASLTSANYITLFRHLPWIHGTRDRIARNRGEMAQFFQSIIDHHREHYDEDNIRDIVDAYLCEIKQTEKENPDYQIFEGKNKDRQMQQILGDLFSAGMETVKNTLEWAVIFMLHHPEAAKAVQNELDEVVGRTRMPSLEDLPYLPLTEATIQEVLRRSNIVPLGTPHATTRDVKLNGYTLPAGTHVMPLVYAVHMDPELWEEPEAFRPERFLASDGKVRKPEYFMPFGVGRRMCLGDLLARMELFLFFSSLMHKFDLLLPEGAPLPSLRGNVGITQSPKPFEVCFSLRCLEPPEYCPSNDGNPNGPLRNIGSH